MFSARQQPNPFLYARPVEAKVSVRCSLKAAELDSLKSLFRQVPDYRQRLGR